MRQMKTGAMTVAVLAAGVLATSSASAADLRSAPPPMAPPPVYVAAPFFVNISGMFGSYNMSNTRTSVLSFGPAGLSGQGISRNSGGFTGGVLATFAPLAPFGVSPWFGTITPIFQVGWFGDLNNTTQTTLFPTLPGINGAGTAQLSTRSGVPIMGGISFPLSAVPFPLLNGGFFATTTIQLSAGVQITQRSASFGLLEVAGGGIGVNAAGVPFAVAGATGFTGAARRYTTTDPAFSFGTMTPIPLDTPFGRPTLTSNMTVISSRSRNVLAQSSIVANQFYLQRTRSGTEFRATSGLGFSFGGPGAGLFR